MVATEAVVATEDMRERREEKGQAMVAMAATERA